MEQFMKAVELQIWREEGEAGMWRCRVIAPDVRHTVRLDDYQALSAFVANQVNMFVENQLLQDRPDVES